MSRRIIAIQPDGYRHLAALPAHMPDREAMRELISWSVRRSSSVILREPSGRRVSVHEAMDRLGLGYVDRWNVPGWLARTEPKGEQP